MMDLVCKRVVVTCHETLAHRDLVVLSVSVVHVFVGVYRI